MISIPWAFGLSDTQAKEFRGHSFWTDILFPHEWRGKLRLVMRENVNKHSPKPRPGEGFFAHYGRAGPIDGRIAAAVFAAFYVEIGKP